MTPLHSFGNLLRETLQNVPLFAVRILFVGTLALLLAWVLRLPKSAVSPSRESGKQDSRTRSWDENLKPVAAIAIIIQLVIYCWL